MKTRLDGWKAVAAHIGRSERTVHRWAKERGLPVYHVAGGGSVFAWAEELDAWFARVREEPGERDEPLDSGDVSVTGITNPVLVSSDPDVSKVQGRKSWLGPAGLVAALLLVAAVVAVRGFGGQPQRLASAPTVVGPSRAVQYVGRTVTVCGRVVSASYAQDSRGTPTFLDLDKPYPKEEFRVIIWGTHRSKFGTPELTLLDKRICATGRVEMYRGVAEIEVATPSALQVPQ